VVPYYDSPASIGPEYLAVAQVRDGVNLAAGIAMLQKLDLSNPHLRFELAEGWRKAGRPKQAIAEYEEVLRSQPRWMQAWRALALLRYPDPGPMSAGLRIAPDDAFLLTLRGTALDSEEDLRRAIAADPDLPEAYVNLGTLLARRGETAKAIELFRQALSVDPRNQPAWTNLQKALAPPSR
jgi:tetratricopeptide (TPR) repeat protein